MMATCDLRNDVINKFIQIEGLAWKGRHWIDQSEPDWEKAKVAVKRMDGELAELEALLKMES